jgi:hypothetical protein
VPAGVVVQDAAWAGAAAKSDAVMSERTRVKGEIRKRMEDKLIAHTQNMGEAT